MTSWMSLVHCSIFSPENAVDDSIEAYKNTITLAQFEKRYESLFSLLGVNDIEYNIAEENISGNSKKVIKYTMTYKTQSAPAAQRDMQ